MTQPPPPEHPGSYPPPPGYYPPGAAMPPTYVPGRPYASWGARVGAYLLDGIITFLILVVPAVVGLIMAFKDAEVDQYDAVIASTVNWGGIVIAGLGALLAFAFGIWNRGLRVGTRGQSIGKQIVGIEVVSDQTGQHIGAGMGIVRLILDSILGNACFLNYLWPLWDDKHQTWHDMIVKSVVLTKP